MIFKLKKIIYSNTNTDVEGVQLILEYIKEKTGEVIEISKVNMPGDPLRLQIYNTMFQVAYTYFIRKYTNDGEIQNS